MHLYVGGGHICVIASLALYVGVRGTYIAAIGFFDLTTASKINANE